MASNSAAKAGRTSPSALAIPQEQPWPGNLDFANRPVPLAGPRQWLRLVVAGGSSKCWVSGDGVHWGRVLDGRDRYGSWQTIALYAREASDRNESGHAARHIRLRSLQVRELSGLTTAAAADLLAKAAAASVAMKTGQGETPQAWTQRIDRLAPRAHRPLGMARACTLQALVARGQPTRSIRCCCAPFASVSSELRSTQAKIDPLQDAALIWRPDWNNAQR